MNFKGLILAGVGVFLIYIVAKGTYKDVWGAVSRKGGANGG